MNENLNPKGLAGSFSWKQPIFGLLLGLGLSSPAHAMGGLAVSVAGWSLALVIVLAVAYFFGRKIR